MASETERRVGRVNLLAVWRSNIVQDGSERSFARWTLQFDLTPLDKTIITEDVAAIQVRFIHMGSQTYGALAIVVIERAGTGCSDRCIVVISHHAVHACNIPTTARRDSLI
jgi:hypothetical protein